MDKRKEDLELIEREHNLAPEIVAGIVSSAGGPSVLKKIIHNLKDNIKISIIIAQHISEGFMKNFAGWLKSETSKKIKIAKNGEKIKKGFIYFPPDGYHIRLDGKRIKLLNSPPINGIRPSGNLLLKSIAESYGKNSVGVILTGMGKDGSEGIAEIFKRGGITVAQKPDTAFLKSMPQEAINSGLIKYDLSPEEIAKFLSKLEVKKYEDFNSR